MSNGETHTPTDLQALEQFVVENDELLELEERIGRFNIFDALRIVDAEIRHSNFLAWLLDPNESHGQGPLFLKAVLMDLLRQSPPDLRPLSPVQIDGAELRGVDIRREWRNIDILISCKDPAFVVAIENKIKAGKYNPFKEYEKRVQTEFPGQPTMFVLLTTDGSELEDSQWVPYSYEDIHSVLKRVRKTHATSIGDDVLAFLDHYIRLIGSRFMDDPKIDELCQTIYKNHRQAIDLIVDRVSTVPAYDEILKVVEVAPGWSVLHKTRKIIYTTLNAFMWMPPRLATSKPIQQAWILFCFNWYPDSLKLEIYIGEADDVAKRESMVKFFLENQDKFHLKMPKKPGPRYTTLRSYLIGTWKKSEPAEEVYVRKACEILGKCEEQFLVVNEELKKVVESW